MSEGLIGIPKKAFVYGSPSRNEGHSKKKSLPYQSGTQMIKRLVKKKMGGQKNKASKSIKLRNDKSYLKIV